MAYHGNAQISSRSPRALAICDRCSGLYNHQALRWQYQWQGPNLQNRHLLVCPSCLDQPQQQLRTVILPPDPLPILNPRPEAYTDADAPISGLGSNIGSMTSWGGLASAFDGNNSKPSRLCAASPVSVSGYGNTVGKRWAVATQPVPTDASSQTVSVTRFKLYAPSDLPIYAVATPYKLQGSNDNATWTDLYTSATAGTIAESIDVDSGITSGDYSYHRVNFTGDGARLIALSQFVIYGTGLSGQY